MDIPSVIVAWNYQRIYSVGKSGTTVNFVNYPKIPTDRFPL